MSLDLGINSGKGFGESFGEDFGLDSDLVRYVQGVIVPRYDGFDGAHSRSHVECVIGQSLEIFSLLVEDEGCDLGRGLDVNMVYVVAAYHDLGLCEGRDLHREGLFGRMSRCGCGLILSRLKLWRRRWRITGHRQRIHRGLFMAGLWLRRTGLLILRQLLRGQFFMGCSIIRIFHLRSRCSVVWTIFVKSMEMGGI